MFKNFLIKKIKLPNGETLKVWYPNDYQESLDWIVNFWQGNYENYETVQVSNQASVFCGNVPGISDNVFLKKLHVRKKIDYLKNAVRSTRAKRAMEMGIVAEDYGFFAPHSLFLIESSKYGLHRECGLISAEITDAPPVARWLGNAELTGLERIEFIQAFAREIAKWHTAGFHHGDLRLGNVLAKKIGDRWQFYFLDNERNSRKLPVRRDKVIHNLMQINMILIVSVCERLFFWREYNKIMQFDRNDTKTILKRVQSITVRRLTEKGLL